MRAECEQDALCLVVSTRAARSMRIVFTHKRLGHYSHYSATDQPDRRGDDDVDVWIDREGVLRAGYRD